MTKINLVFPKNTFLIVCIAFIGLHSQTLLAQTPLPRAHAHNDYMHEHPLTDALDQGFCNVEADVLLIDGELYVGHDMPKKNEQLPTLEQAYLMPLLNRVKENNGKIYADYKQPVYLMIDFKTDADKTYQVLKKELVKYQEMLTSYQDDKLEPGAVTIFISGNRPISQVEAEKVKWVGIDGRPEDLKKNYSSTFMPVISDSYINIITWDGNGKISPKDKKTLSALANEVHKQGKKLRLWASPDQPNAWKTLMDAGVDLVNTDRLADLKEFMLSQQNN